MINKKRVISNGIILLIVLFLVFASSRIVFAFSPFSFGLNFGGRIISTKAIQIQALESAGFQCVVPGTSISITPIGSPIATPTSYFIPAYVISKTGTTPLSGRLILGKYGGKTMITCIYPYPPHVQTVSLDTITLFGTSRF